ncbi:isochorismatase family protein [Rhodococcus sp. NPDC060176]|uniref:isochorismatase family protein n=1 Tax=Rhodococcus sp. NPDC060176 TaxID=3347062 RepID=UPI00364AE828
MTAPRRALVLVDIQQEYFDGPLEIQFPPRDESLANILNAVDAADEHNIPVVLVQHRLPEGAPIFAEGSKGWSLYPDLKQRIKPSWKHVHKQHSSVFADTDVAEWLRAKDVDTITIVGYMTNNCDLATAAEAEAHGLITEILSDATGAIHLSNEAGEVSAQSLHTTLMVLLQSNLAAVTTTTQWIDALHTSSSLPKSNLIESALNGRSATPSV